MLAGMSEDLPVALLKELEGVGAVDHHCHPLRRWPFTLTDLDLRPRPGKWGVRMLEPMVVISYITDQQNRMVGRTQHFMNGFYLQDGSFINVIYQRDLDVLDVPFVVPQTKVSIPVGTYKFDENCTGTITFIDPFNIPESIYFVVAESGGQWNVYAGGYSDMVAQRGAGVVAKSFVKAETRPPREKSDTPSAPATKRRLSFNEKHALETLPARIAKLETKIAKLSRTIADPSLYARDRAAFDTASAALATAQAELVRAEDEWLRLEELREQVEAR